MTFDATLYHYDRERRDPTASLKRDAVLYRLASLNHCTRRDVANGTWRAKSNGKGRFHAPNQIANYCADNVIVCIAEVLFHMYRQFLKGIKEKKTYEEIYSATQAKRCLVVFRVNDISDLVYIDSEGARSNYDSRVGGTAIIHPDEHYEPFWDVQNQLRSASKRGVICPSARHSQGHCIVLFQDETKQVLKDNFKTLNMILTLIPENQDWKHAPQRCDPFCDRAHSTMGHYEFEKEADFKKVNASGVLNPANIPSKGLIDFVRRRYVKYPDDAICK